MHHLWWSMSCLLVTLVPLYLFIQDASLCRSAADSTVDNLGDAVLQSDAAAASSCLPSDHYVCCYCSTTAACGGHWLNHTVTGARRARASIAVDLFELTVSAPLN